MQTPPFQALKTRLSRAWDGLCRRVQTTPKEWYVVGGLCLIVVLLVGVHTAFSQKTAILRVNVQHSFRTAQIKVLVDDETAYSGKLAGVEHKKFGLIPEGIQGRSSLSIPVAAGSHQISVRVIDEDGSEHVNNTAAQFARGSERELLVVARHTNLTATWGANSNVATANASAPLESQPSWLTRYANALFLTIAGSIVSALSGYAIREIPARLRNRAVEQKPAQSAAAGR